MADIPTLPKSLENDEKMIYQKQTKTFTTSEITQVVSDYTENFMDVDWCYYLDTKHNLKGNRAMLLMSVLWAKFEKGETKTESEDGEEGDEEGEGEEGEDADQEDNE